MTKDEVLTPIVTPKMSDVPDAQKIFDNLTQLDEKAIANCNAVYSEDIVRQAQLDSSLVADRIFYDGQTYGHFSINAENVADAIGAVDAQVHMMTQGKDMYAKNIAVEEKEYYIPIDPPTVQRAVDAIVGHIATLDPQVGIVKNDVEKLKTSYSANKVQVDTTAQTNFPLESTVQAQFESQDSWNKYFDDAAHEHGISINIIEDKLGDIDTALDKIIEIQNTLIGGGE